MNVEQLARYEFKYAIQPPWLDEIRAMMRPYCHLDTNANSRPGGLYTIDSLYFDNSAGQLYWDCDAKLSHRLKLRVRAYPDVPGSVVKIELKRRIHELIVKTSTVVSYQGWAEWLQGRRDPSMLPAAARQSLQEFLAVRDRIRAYPRVMVRYTRQAFHSMVDDYVRVTFDQQVLAQTSTRYDLAVDPTRWMPVDDPASIGAPGALLMEVKFKHRPPVWMSNIIYRFNLVRQGYSKFESACRRYRCDDAAYWDLASAESAFRRRAA